MRHAMKVADRQSKNTFAKMCPGFGKAGSDREQAPAHTPALKPKRHGLKDEQPADMVAYSLRVEGKTELGEEVTFMGASKELRELNLEQNLATKREVPSDMQDVWQLVDSLRSETQRLEEETEQRFTVQTQVNRALIRLALSGQGRVDFLKDLDSLSANSLDEARRSGDARARREVLLTQFDSPLGNDVKELCSARDVQVNVPAVQVVQNTVEDPQAQFTNTVIDIPVVQRRQIRIDMSSAVQHHTPHTWTRRCRAQTGHRSCSSPMKSSTSRS